MSGMVLVVILVIVKKFGVNVVDIIIVIVVWV